MPVLIKAFGFCFIVLSSWGFGAVKVADFKRKKNNLQLFIVGLDKLFDDVRLYAFEAKPMIKKNFEEYGFLDVSGDKISTKKGCFFEKDTKTVNEFFISFGESDKTGECDRIKLYSGIFSKRYAELQEEYKAKSRVWQTVCLCAGIAVGVLFI